MFLMFANDVDITRVTKHHDFTKRLTISMASIYSLCTNWNFCIFIAKIYRL